jgi:hypothetical protein
VTISQRVAVTIGTPLLGAVMTIHADLLAGSAHSDEPAGDSGLKSATHSD